MRNLFSDLTDDLDAAPSKEDLIRAAAHIVNGGDASFPCPKCQGRGTVMIGYRYRGARACFKCKGSGKVSKGVAAAAKGKVTKENNRRQFAAAHTAEISYAHRRADRGSTYYATLLTKLEEFGSWKEVAIEGVRKDMAADQAKRAEWDAQRQEKGGEVNIAAIEALFSTATDNDIKRPIFRAEGIEISKASASGRNAGALYVKSNDDVYLGKIVAGKFVASREATDDTLGQLRAVAQDPTAEAIKYARRTGRCSCCGKGLVDPVSIRAGIGPICAERWGLDYRRELAEESLAAEKPAKVARPAAALTTAGKYDHLYLPGMTAQQKQAIRAKARREA